MKNYIFIIHTLDKNLPQLDWCLEHLLSDSMHIILIYITNNQLTYLTKPSIITQKVTCNINANNKREIKEFLDKIKKKLLKSSNLIKVTKMIMYDVNDKVLVELIKKLEPNAVLLGPNVEDVLKSDSFCDDVSTNCGTAVIRVSKNDSLR